jgi:monofunctional biosynthetic peptidoglycan transglycosylase
MKYLLRFIIAIILLPVGIVGIVTVALAFLVLSTPDVRHLRKCIVATMHQVELCPTGPNYVSLKQISPVAVAAVLASEDTTFYQHNGFDWFEIKNSLSKDIHEKGFARGGSTITQQLAKNVYLSGRKSLTRKIREAFLTYMLEKNLSKDEILEKYLNVVELGPNIYGIKAASNYYFKKSPAQLNVLEGAFLAFLLPNPKGYFKSYKDKKLTPFARSRVVDIVYRLMRFHKISPEVYDQAKVLVGQFPWTNVVDADLNAKSLTAANTKEFIESPAPANEEATLKSPIAPSTEENDDPDDDGDSSENMDSRSPFE